MFITLTKPNKHAQCLKWLKLLRNVQIRIQNLMLLKKMCVVAVAVKLNVIEYISFSD